MKKYTELTEQEKVALSDAEFHDSCKLEAIDRGFKLPITLENAMKQIEFPRVINLPDTTSFFEVCAPASYGDRLEPTKLCFRTLAEANKAIENAICIDEEGYGNDKKRKFLSGSFEVKETKLTFSNGSQFAVRVEEMREDTTEIDKVVKECVEDLSAIHQRKYNAEVILRKRTEYLRLANGDEAIAAAFWVKTEGGEFPKAPD